MIQKDIKYKLIIFDFMGMGGILPGELLHIDRRELCN